MMVNAVRQTRWVLTAFTTFALFAAYAYSAVAAESAVVLMYHRFGEGAFPTTNTKLEQLEAHIAEIQTGKFVVKPLPKIVAAMRARQTLPDNTIGISVDDAYLSVYREAWPRLRKANLPFTLFVATNAIDRGSSGYMSWTQIREMARAGITIGSQTASHPNMPLLSAARNAEELRKSNDRFKAELGQVPTLIAYPYGEYSLAVREVTKNAGFIAAFGQHSGVIHPDSDFYFLPRFAFNENFGDVSRFRMAARALPLRTTDLTPADTLLSIRNNPPLFGFTIRGLASKRLSQLACYVSRQGKVRIERLGERRIEVRMNKAFDPGRTRINCTLPEAGGRWRWFGRQFVMPR